MGQAFLLGGNLAASGAPYVSQHPSLTPGSLILTDFSHSANPAGVPANGGVVENLAWREAAAILGSGDKTTLASNFVNTFVSAEGGFERTSKGALYGAVSRTAQNSHAAYINAAQAIINYFTGHPTREFAFFWWGEVMRPATSASTGNMKDAALGNSSAFASNNLFTQSFANSVGKQRLALQKNAWTGAPNGTAAQNTLRYMCWGNHPSFNSLIPDDGRSMILHQFHAIDVALSGKTYAELNALDAALYAAAYAAGGRFNGETTSLVLGDYP